MVLPTSAAAFRSLIERSGLLGPEQLAAHFDPAASGEEDPEAVQKTAKVLVSERLLTPFQADQLLKGRHKGFFITDKFKLLSFIAAGGMGAVYLCEHLMLGRLVAIKMLQVPASGGEQRAVASAVERFLREARALAALDDPNIVRVFDVDRINGKPFVVMEYVDGSNLHSIVEQAGPLPEARAVHYARQAALGLQHAHEVGLVHRDIKPGNILVDRNGVVKLLDLGLARFSQDTARNHGITTRLDQNMVIGTVDFMAPEQALDGSRVDIRSDIYSLGCTLYFLLAGRVPFPEGTVAQKMLSHQNLAPEPLSELVPRMRPDLARVIERMIEKHPDDRPQTPREVADALGSLGLGEVGPPPADEMPRHPASFYRLGLCDGPPSEAAAVNTPSPDFHETESTFRLFDATPTPPGFIHPTESHPPTRQYEAYRPHQQDAYKGGRGWRIAVFLLLLGWTGGTLGVIYYWMRTLEPPAGPVTSKPVAPPDLLVAPAINAGGTAFVDPVMHHWASLYQREHGVRIAYQATGSDKGILGLNEGLYSFACTDSDHLPPGAARVPLLVGAVVVAYNLPEEPNRVRFTGEILANIFLGKITHWDDEALVIANPELDLPHLEIRPVHRDGDIEATSTWTEYLSGASAEWERKRSLGRSSDWPVGIAADGSVGVVNQVNRHIGAIGFVELPYAVQSGLPYGEIRNAAGRYVEPSIESAAAAAAAAMSGDDLTFRIVDAPGPDSYPIAGVAWALFYPQVDPKSETHQMIRFFRWAVRDGQYQLHRFRYSPLPSELIERIEAELDRIEES